MGGALCALHLDVTPPVDLPSTGFGWALLKMVGALILVCALIYLTLRLARRHFAVGGGQGRLLRVIERCPLSARQCVWLVEVDGRLFLLGSSDGPGGSVTTLAELERGASQGQAAPGPRSFREVLRQSDAGPSGSVP
jgi:flagellar biogenesis protein FliO